MLIIQHIQNCYYTPRRQDHIVPHVANVKKYRDDALEAIPKCAEVVKLLLSAKPFHCSLYQLSQFLHSNGFASEQEVTFF